MNDQYPELYQTFQWLIPSQFNIAQACVHRWAENSVEGRRIAIYHEDAAGIRSVWTYTRLAETTRQLANGLIKMGVQPGDRVAIAMDQRPEAIAACMAAFSVGAVATPLASGLPVDSIASRLQDAGARVAIVDTESGASVLAAQARCPALSQIVALDFAHEAVMSWRTLLARQPSTFRDVATRSDSAALLLYTSGATGAPKGVLLPHSALLGSLPGFVASQNWFPLKGDIFWTPLEWASNAGLLNGILPALYFGHAVVGAQGGYPPARVLEILARYRITNAFVSPAMLRELAAQFPAPRQDHMLTLRALAVGGESLSVSNFDWCAKALGVTPNEVYGLAETGCVIGNSAGRWPARPGSMGRVIPGHQIALLDNRGRPCRAGVVGEIAVHRRDSHGHADPSLFLAYWNRPEDTQSAFSGDWYLTGDLASLDTDGYYWHAGRRDDVFRVSGHRVGPAAIEDCLLTHAAVAGAAVVAKPDPNHGASVKAYVVLAPNAHHENDGALQAELQAYVRHQLASYQTPREIEFVDSLPTTPAGTLRRHVLRARELQQAGVTG